MQMVLIAPVPSIAVFEPHLQPFDTQVKSREGQAIIVTLVHESLDWR